MLNLKWIFIYLAIVLGISKLEAQLTIGPQLSIKDSNDLKMLQNTINSSDLVVEGRFISRKGFFGAKHRIYTSNILVIYKVFKGNPISDTLEVITPDGTVYDSVNGQMVRVAKSISEGAGYARCLSPEGLFFLKNNDWEAKSSSSYHSYRPNDWQLNYYFDYGNPAAIYHFIHFKNIRQEVYALICNFTDQQYVVHSIPKIGDVDTTMKGMMQKRFVQLIQSDTK